MTNMTDSTLEKRAMRARRDRQGTANSLPSIIHGRDSNRREDGPAPRGIFPKRICTVQPGVNKGRLALESTYNFEMLRRSGRRERRTRLAVAVQISSFREPAAQERTITENVCSRGLRVFTQGQMEKDEPLLVSSTTGDVRVQARVVYCHRLRDGRFAVGLHFQGAEVHWPESSLASVAE